MLDQVLSFKGEAKKLKKIVEFNLYWAAHNVSGFGSYIVINNLPQRRSIVEVTKSGAGFRSHQIFNGYVDENQKNPHYVHFRYGRVHIKKKIQKRVLVMLQPSLLKQGMKLDVSF